jgi:hypothetical protein
VTPLVGTERQQVPHFDLATVDGMPRRREHHRVGQVAALGSGADDRSDAPVPGVAIEERGEERW